MHDRKDNAIKNTGDIIGVIGFFAGGPGLASGIFTVLSSAYSRNASAGDDGSITGLYPCAYSFIAHTIQKPTDPEEIGARKMFDLFCMAAAK